jgi:hypothetical protein
MPQPQGMPQGGLLGAGPMQQLGQGMPQGGLLGAQTSRGVLGLKRGGEAKKKKAPAQGRMAKPARRKK